MSNLNLHQIKRFIISGGSATCLHFIVMGLLIFGGMDAIWATSIGAASGAVFNYILQYYYTFVSDRRHLHSMAAYLMAASLAWLTNLGVFSLLHKNLGEFALLHKNLGAGIIISQLVTTLIVTIQNYLVYKKLVFFKNTTIAGKKPDIAK